VFIANGYSSLSPSYLSRDTKSIRPSTASTTSSELQSLSGGKNYRLSNYFYCLLLRVSIITTVIWTISRLPGHCIPDSGVSSKIRIGAIVLLDGFTAQAELGTKFGSVKTIGERWQWLRAGGRSLYHFPETLRFSRNISTYHFLKNYSF